MALKDWLTKISLQEINLHLSILCANRKCTREILLFTNKIENVNEQYLRYLQNRIREDLGFSLIQSSWVFDRVVHKKKNFLRLILNEEILKFSVAMWKDLHGIKQHLFFTLFRKNIPILSPEKDEYGRQSLFTARFRFCFRLKYLINEKVYCRGGRRATLRKVESEKTTDTTPPNHFKMQKWINQYVLFGKKQHRKLNSYEK